VIDGIAHVPKLVLISRLQALLHEGRLKIQKDLPEANNLVSELIDFRVQYTQAGHLTFNAREGRHDDLVLALAIACYCAAGGGARYQGLLDFYAGGVETRHFVGLDLGQSRDPTAVAVVRRAAAVLDEPQPSAPAVLLYARPYAAFQAASGQKYTAEEDGRIEVINPDDARDLKRCGCRVAHG
jgi:hypothetical protein